MLLLAVGMICVIRRYWLWEVQLRDFLLPVAFAQKSRLCGRAVDWHGTGEFHVAGGCYWQAGQHN